MDLWDQNEGDIMGTRQKEKMFFPWVSTNDVASYLLCLNFSLSLSLSKTVIHESELRI